MLSPFFESERGKKFVLKLFFSSEYIKSETHGYVQPKTGIQFFLFFSFRYK